MVTRQHTYGIKGQQAPELLTDIQWIDGSGKEMEPIQLSQFDLKFKVHMDFNHGVLAAIAKACLRSRK